MKPLFLVDYRMSEEQESRAKPSPIELIIAAAIAKAEKG